MADLFQGLNIPTNVVGDRTPDNPTGSTDLFSGIEGVPALQQKSTLTEPAPSTPAPTSYKGAFGNYSDVSGIQAIKETDTKGLETPAIDPVTAFVAPVGAVGYLGSLSAKAAVDAGLMTMGSAARQVFFRAGAAGILSAGAEYALDVPARAAGKIAPILDPIVRIGGSIASGISIENYVDNLIQDAMNTRQASRVFNEAINEFKKSKTISDLFFKEHQDIIDAANRGDQNAFADLVNKIREDALFQASEKFANPLARHEKILATDTADIEAKIESKIATGGNLSEDDLADIKRLSTIQSTKDFAQGFEDIRKASIAREASDAYDNSPVTLMYDWMKKEGQVVNPNELRSAGFTEQMVKVLQKKYPGIFEEGVDVSNGIIKKMGDHGWSDVDDMMKDFFIAPTKDQIIRKISSRDAAEWASQFRDEITSRAMERQAQYIFRAYGYNTKKAMRTVMKIDPNTLVGKILDQAKSSQNVERLLVKGTKAELKTAGQQQAQALIEQRQLLNQAIELKKTRKILTDLYRGTNRNISIDYQEQLRHFLRNIMEKKAAAPERSMFQFITEKADRMLGFSTVAERFNKVLNIPPGKTFDQLTLGEARELRKFVDAFKLAGRAENFVKVKSQRVLADTVAKNVGDELDSQFNSRFLAANQAEALGPKGGYLATKMDSVRRATRNFDAYIARIEPLIKQMDGFKENGIAWRTIFKPFVDAEQLESSMAENTYGRLRAAFKEHPINSSRKWQKVVGELDGNPVSRESALMLHLNMTTKNPENIKALSLGLNMKPQEIQKFLDDVITPEDKALAEKIYSIFDEMYAAMAKTYKEQTGLTLQKVKGRYFPIVRDLQAARTGVNITENGMTDQNIVDYTLRRDIHNYWNQVEQGAFKTRKGGVARLKLDMDVIVKHVQDVAHGVTHWGPINDVQRVVRNGNFKMAVQRNLGDDVYKEFDNWISNLTRPYQVDNPLLRRLRIHTTVGMLGLAPTTAMKQTLSGISAIPEVGVGSMLKSMKDLVANPWSFFKDAYDLSPALARRKHTWQREIAELAQTIHGRQKLIVSPKLMDAYFSMIHFMDAVTSTAVWRAAYNKSQTATGGNLEEAIRFADEVVRRTQPASMAKDLPRVMRSGEFSRSLTMFYSYYSVLHNQARMLIQRGVVKNMTPTQVTKGLLTMLVAPMIAWEIGSTAINNMMGRDDKLELGKAVGAGLMQATAGIPVVRDVASAALLGYDYQVSPMVEPLKAGTTTLYNIEQSITGDKEEWSESDLLTALEATGFAFKLPTRAFTTAIDAYYKNNIGEINDPFAYISKPPRQK